jgi:transcriptional regulator with XRE-family HTH domain
MLNIIGIVQRIEEIRSNHQLSASAFASKIGVQRSAMSHILSGRNKPSLDFLMKVYEVFDEVSLEWLLIGSSAPTSTNIKKKLFNNVEDELDKTQGFYKKYPTAEEIDNQKSSSIPLDESASPKEIIYIYGDGSFERFTPKK